MEKVFIIHGFQGWPNKGWKAWLMDKLGGGNIYACALPMPNTDHPKMDEWLETINFVMQKESSEHCILVGHSLGVPAILRYLELEKSKKIKGVVFCAGPYKILRENDPNSYAREIDHFLDHPFDFNKIKEKVENIIIIHDSKDESVPYDHGQYLAKQLSGTLVTVSKDDNHLSDDCHELPEAYEAILKMLNK